MTRVALPSAISPSTAVASAKVATLMRLWAIRLDSELSDGPNFDRT